MCAIACRVNMKLKAAMAAWKCGRVLFISKRACLAYLDQGHLSTYLLFKTMFSLFRSNQNTGEKLYIIITYKSQYTQNYSLCVTSLRQYYILAGVASSK